MQLTRDNSALNFIRAWEPGRVRIAERWVAGNVIIGTDRIIEGWTTARPHALSIADLEPALALEPTIIVLGTGTEHLLPDVELMTAVAARSAGLEIMSTPAACRTFNVLLKSNAASSPPSSTLKRPDSPAREAPSRERLSTGEERGDRRLPAFREGPHGREIPPARAKP